MIKRLMMMALAFLTASGPAAAVEPAADMPTNFSRIDSYLETNQQAMGIPGMALAIVQGGQVVHRKGFGKADQTGRPVTTDTPFLLASVSKPIAAVAVMQLVEQGKLDLDLPVVHYIPWFRIKSPDGGATITVRHLLHQTSGIPRDAGYPPLLQNRLQSLEDAARDIARFRPDAAVGERFIYSNANFVLLGLLVETVSGQSYEAYVRANILEPLGMNHTYFSDAQAQASGLAQGYTTMFGRPVPMSHPHFEHSTPYYGLISTADDLARFTTAMLGEGRFGDVQLLTSESVKAMTARPESGSEYALGWWVWPFHDRPAVSHGGDAFHFRNELILLPQDGIAVILLTNQNAHLTTSWHVRELAWSVASLMVGKTAYSPARDFWRMNGLMVAAALFLLILLIAWAYFLYRWQSLFHLGQIGLGPGLLLPAMLSIAVGGAMLLWGPRPIQRADWPMALVNQPDLAWTGLLFSLGLVAAGLLHGTIGWWSTRGG